MLNIQEKKVSYTYNYIGVKWSDLMERTAKEMDIGEKKGRVQGRRTHNTRRTVEPGLNNEYHKESKKLIHASRVSNYNRNPILESWDTELDQK